MARSKTIQGISLSVALAFGAGHALAGDFRIRTDVGASSFIADATSLENSLGFAQAKQASGSARIMWDGQIANATTGLHLNMTGAKGSAVALANAFATEDGPPPSLFDLRADFDTGHDELLIGVLDRAYLTFSSDKTVVTIGRQAITWGGGVMFQPMDIVAPFSPDAIDTAYKPGVEMIYGQYLFDNGADVQAIYVPRAAQYGGSVNKEHSTTAVLGTTTIGPLDARALVGQDRGRTVIGVGLGGPLVGAAWNVEWVGLEANSGSFAPFWVANISNFSSLGDWNLSYFAEFYHNPLGVASQTAVDALPTDLVDRMSYGQIFLPGRDFLGLGGTIQVSPDVTISPTAIISLEDGSYLARMAVGATLSDSADVFLDVAVPVGDDGTEFGGRETTAGSGVFVGPPMTASLRFVKHF